MAYRVATCIELHEAGVVLIANKNADHAPRGRTEYATRPAYKINLGDIAMIAEMWGIDTPRTIKRPAYTDQSFIRPSEKKRFN